MIFIWGKRKMRIKKYVDHHIKCEECNSYEQKFSVYQEYFHIFFIPIFPFGIKTIQSVCLKCNDAFNGEKKSHYLSITRTPVYLYTGIILFVGFILSLVIGNVTTQKQKAEYVANPQINDVYLIRENDENKSKIYYFMKIKNINADTVELLGSHFQYSRFVYKMDDTDYFVSGEIYKVSKTDLKDYLENSIIISVERDYDKSSRFMIEKENE